MNKKNRILKKRIKRGLKDIGYKKSCKNLKESFLKENKTAIYNGGFFHPSWEVFPQPSISELENGYIVDGTETFLPLCVKKQLKKS
jgi:hypothetical protein